MALIPATVILLLLNSYVSAIDQLQVMETGHSSTKVVASRNGRERCFDAPWTVNFAIMEKKKNLKFKWKDCEWLESKKSDMVENYCTKRLDIRRLCSHTCNSCDEEVSCSDSPLSVKFKLNLLDDEAPDEGNLVGCIWLSRMPEWSRESICKRRVDVRKICQKTCHVCTTQSPTINSTNSPSTIPPTPDPTNRPSSLPTVSPSSSGMPTSEPSILPSLSPTECQDNPNFKLHIGFGERKRCIWIARDPQRIETYCRKEEVKENCRYTCCVCETENCSTNSPSVGPTQYPTSDSPTDIPSYTPTVEPSLNPSGNPSLSAAPTECRDDPLFTFHIDGDPFFGERRRCMWIGRTPDRIERYCEYEAVNNHCRFTCCVCERGGCTAKPSDTPTLHPTDGPTLVPTASPTSVPTPEPTSSPTLAPTSNPTASPTSFPTVAPTDRPSYSPTISFHPTEEPTVTPTKNPSSSPSFEPTNCEDDPSFTFYPDDRSLFFGESRRCAWVARALNRIQTYCILEDVFESCRFTCCACQREDCTYVRPP